MIAVLGKMLCFLLILSSGNICAQEARTLASSEEKIKIITSHIKNKYGVHVLYKGLPQTESLKYIYTEAEENDTDKLLKYLKIFTLELYKYPKSFFKGKELHSIIFVKKLFFNEKPAEGLYSYNDKVIFFDFSRNERNPLLQKHSIHHEFYHMMDIMQPGWRDPIWNTFNPPDFKYFGENAFKKGEKYRRKNYKIAREKKGFITPYAMTSAEEDKAEIFACLMMKSQNKILHRWIKHDEFLQQKTNFIKARIQEFCNDMNEEYWKNLFRQ